MFVGTGLWVFVIVVVVLLALVVFLIVGGALRAKTTSERVPVKTDTTPIPDASQRNPQTRRDSRAV